MSQSGFSFFRSIGWFDEKKVDLSSKQDVAPSLSILLDKEIYRPGDLVTATVEICSPRISNGYTDGGNWSNKASSFLLDNFSFEVKGIEKLDCQWFSTQKPLPGLKQRRGECLFLDCMAPSIVSKVIISSGCSKTYVLRVELPKILPPSYRGVAIRYIYYVRSTISGRWFVLDNNDGSGVSTDDLIQVEARAPLQIWVLEKSNNLLTEEGNLPIAADQLDIYWREKDADSEWVRANESLDVLDEEYDSSKDESIASRLSSNDFHNFQADRTTVPSHVPLAQLSVAEAIDDPGADEPSPQNRLNDSLSTPSHGQQRSSQESKFLKDDIASPCTPKPVEPLASEGFIRGRSYNIKIDDQTLLRFSPKNSDSTYYFGDMIGGTLTFFHGGFRRCLEIAVTLEIAETVTQRFIHPSRRSSPTITKVQSEHHEVSVQWSLRFEFFTTPKDLDLSRYEHPLLIEQREKGEWILPITVHAPPLRFRAGQTTEKPLSLGNLQYASEMSPSEEQCSGVEPSYLKR
ncbi:hypothetical protein OPV22_009294 [Ensete ventricosum]|uniref:Arrestin-like N-terminal domain-containing protein n=1 Tax=Ensete ventricosum TaxID=4639 RepID=A0AAV8RCZ6_ENSVE|nr:hypothetical protein OPV22_009294 [Ensete ventricosum]